MADHARGLLGRAERAKLAHRTCRIEAAPRQGVKTRIPEELVWVFHGVRARIAEVEAGSSAAFPPILLEDASSALQYVGIWTHGSPKYAYGTDSFPSKYEGTIRAAAMAGSAASLPAWRASLSCSPRWLKPE